MYVNKAKLDITVQIENCYLIKNVYKQPYLYVLLALFLFFSNAHGQEGYRIAPGDRISISVYGEPDLSFSNLPVPTNGVITYPFLGQVNTEYKTEVELAAEITRGLLNGYLLQPQVTVAITEFRPLFIGGAVKQPGQKEFSVNMDVERLIALAGGFTDIADESKIVIQRKSENGRTELPADISTEILPGDVVNVAEKVVQEKIVQYYYLQGEIKSPGRFEFAPELTIRQAVAIAGGFSARASKKKITVTRGDTQQKLNKVDLDSAVQPGDVIAVGASLF